MTFQQLSYAVALDEHRHFVKAANQCFVAQPTLTLQLRKLEEEIGFRLFDRSVQPIEPTKEGNAFIAKARIILQEVESLKNLALESTDAISGEYRVGIIPTLAPYILPLFLGEFSAKYPELRLEVQEMQSTDIIEALSKNRIHIGLMVTPVLESALIEYPLFNEPFYLYTHPDHPLLAKKEINPDDIDGRDLWLLNQGHCFRNQVLNLCGEDIKRASERNFHFESGSIETLKRMVRSQKGCTLVPALAIDMQLEGDFVRPFAKPVPAREVSLVVHRTFAKTKLLEELQKEIISSLPTNMEENVSFSCLSWR